MVDKINFEALDRSDMETAAAFVESIATVARIVSSGDVNEREMRDVLYVIAELLSVAGTILYAGTKGEPLIKPPVKREAIQKEIA